MIQASHGHRVLHIFGCMNRGGAELRTLDIMRRIDRTRYRLEFCALSGEPGDLDDEIRRLDGEVHRCRLGPSFPWRFGRLLRRRGFDAVHSHVLMFSGFLLWLAHRCGIPVRIAHFRSTSSGKRMILRYRLQDRLMRHWIDRHATHILGVGESALSHGWKLAWEKDPRCAVIHNGLDVAPFQTPADPVGVRRQFGWPAGCRLVIHVGRMHPAKNLPRLIEIAGDMMRLDESLRLLLAGAESHELKNRLLERLGNLGLQDRVAFAGTRADVSCLMKAADLMLFPSLWEGLPGTILEACAAGLPVLASDLPGVLEIASRFPSVHCLSLQDSDDRWAAAARDLLEDAGSHHARDAAHRRFAESVYDIKRCVKAHEMAWSGASGTEIRNTYA